MISKVHLIFFLSTSVLAQNLTNDCLSALGAIPLQVNGINLAFATSCNAIGPLSKLYSTVPMNAPFDTADKIANVQNGWNDVFKLLCSSSTPQTCLQVYSNNAADVTNKCPSAIAQNYTLSANLFSNITANPQCTLQNNLYCGADFNTRYSEWMQETANATVAGDSTKLKTIICNGCSINYLTSPFGQVGCLPLPNITAISSRLPEICDADLIKQNTWNGVSYYNGVATPNNVQSTTSHTSNAPMIVLSSLLSVGSMLLWVV